MNQLKSFFLVAIFGLLGITLHSQAQTLNDYPWLNSIVDQQNCCFNEQVQLYNSGIFDLVYIANDADCAGEGGTLFLSDGTVWCMSTPGFDCLSFYNLTLESDLFTCNQSSDLNLLDSYPWLGNVINETDCCTNNTVSLYQNNIGHQYLLVSPDPSCSSANEKWYFSTGQLFCESGPNYDCVSLYGFNDMEIVATWNCGDGDNSGTTEPLTEGADITLRNTLQDPGEAEITYSGLFGLADDAFDEFATLSNTDAEFTAALAQAGTPFGDISGLYNIDFTETSVEFTLLPDETDPFWPMQFGEFPEGKFDRYYFTFSEPHNIVSGASNDTSVNLIVESETVIVVEISAGYNFNPGINFFISFNMAEELSNEDKARAFNTGLINGDASVIKWIRNDYIQHNLGVPDGKAPIAGFYGGQPTGITVDIHRSFEVGEFVFAQTTLGGTWGQFFGSNTDNILYEVWRFENGFAVEHWDNIVAVVDDMDGTSQTDGVATPAIDLELTDANQALLELMSQTLFVDGDWTNVSTYFDIENYVQHSVGAGTDGSFLASLEGQTGVSFYDDVKFIHTLGNFGLVMSQGPDITGQDPDGDYAYYDLFRMDNGKIVEHWDAIQLIPPQDQWAHDNGKWGDDAITSLEGADITLRNTLQDPGEAEITYSGLFGLADDAFDEFATLSNTDAEFTAALAQAGTPFGDISGLYNIDFTETSVEFTLLPDETDPFWPMQFGEFPEGKFDRYYFTFSEPHNIVSGASNDTSVNLIVESETVIIVEISAGYNFNPGINFFISFNMSEELTNLDKALGFNQGLETGNPAALKWMRNDYTQHNVTVPTGKAGIAAFYTGGPIGLTVDINRSFQAGDYVFAQTTFGGSWGAISGTGNDEIIYDVWRFENGFAVEHWDNIGAVIDDMDGTTQTDGVTTPTIDLELTDANQALLEEMSQTLFVDGDWTNVSAYFDIDNYIQHSVGAGTDGAFLASLEGQTGVSFYTSVKYVHTSGNFGLVMSEGPDITGQDPDGIYAYYDLFRIENGLIVEHWDIIQLIPPQDQWANDNGKW